MKTIFTTLIILVFVAPKSETTFIGTIKTDSKIKYDLFGLYIDFRIDTIVIATDFIQKDGTFNISTSNEKKMDLFYHGIGIPETYVQTIDPQKKDTVSLNIKIPNVYKKRLGKVICPKCELHNMIIPIVYGLKTVVVYEGDQLPYKTYDGFGKKEIYDGGCQRTEFHPKYYCKRDGIKF